MALFARRVLDHAVDHFHFGDRYLPGVSGRVDQAGACQGGRHAQVVPGVRHTAGAAGGVQAQLTHGLVEQPVRDPDLERLFVTLHVQRMERQGQPHHQHVAVDRIGASLFQPHFRQGNVQLLGNEHGQCGVHTLAHFGPRHCQHHAAVLRNFDPAVERDFALCGCQHVVRLAQARAHRQGTPAHNQRARCAQAAQYPGAALHAAAPVVPAARWMALRTRW